MVVVFLEKSFHCVESKIFYQIRQSRALMCNVAFDCSIKIWVILLLLVNALSTSCRKLLRPS